jgi:hypothetical protein
MRVNRSSAREIIRDFGIKVRIFIGSRFAFSIFFPTIRRVRSVAD